MLSEYSGLFAGRLLLVHECELYRYAAWLDVNFVFCAEASNSVNL